jgi:hypothetical protein
VTGSHVAQLQMHPPHSCYSAGREARQLQSGPSEPAVAQLDRMGAGRLQLTGFAMTADCFLTIAIVPGLNTAVVPFLLAYGVSYFFASPGRT